MSDKQHSMMVSSEERALLTKLRRERSPKLPTEPYTVIKVTWRDADETIDPVLMRFPDDWYGEWGWSNDNDFGTAERLQEEIIDFEVLATPHVKGVPTDTGLSHQTFAETYPNEVQYHYDGGFADGASAALTRVREVLKLSPKQERKVNAIEAEFEDDGE